jgi:hypothetical protein
VIEENNLTTNTQERPMRKLQLIPLTICGMLFTACDFDIDISGTIDETGSLHGEEDAPDEEDESYDEWDHQEDDEYDPFEDLEEDEYEDYDEDRPEDGYGDDCDDEHERYCEELMYELQDDIDLFIDECDNGNEFACEELEAIFDFLEEECWSEEGSTGNTDELEI